MEETASKPFIEDPPIWLSSGRTPRCAQCGQQGRNVWGRGQFERLSPIALTLPSQVRWGTVDCGGIPGECSSPVPLPPP
jgi:hypothetical protein